jgi:hypothetical protein
MTIELPLKTAIETAIMLVENHLRDAAKVGKANVVACGEYLRAAQAAITGLEREVDEILIEAKSVARTYWSPERRDALLVRIDTYLNADRLRPLLGQAVDGIDSCHDHALKDAHSFVLGTNLKKDACGDLAKVLVSLAQHLRSLSAAMALDRRNYAGPSGIDVPVLMDLFDTLENGQDLAEHNQREKIKALAAAGQQERQRHGLTLAAKIAGTIQELAVGFRIALT